MSQVKRFLYRVLCGFFLGLSVFAPGFSGSVIAITMGIYKDLVGIASNPFKRFKQNVLFCLPLGVGALISAVLFVIGFDFLFERYEKATYLLFVGLIAGNLPVIFTHVKKAGFKLRYLAGGVAAFGVALLFGILSAQGGSPDTETTAALPLLALGGLAGGMTALVPGMSVSMVLIMLKVYNPMISTARMLLDFDLSALLPVCVFGVAAILGLVVASKGIKVVFEKIPGLANTMVFGFMAGSLIGIIYESPQLKDANFNWLLGGAMLAVGLLISMLFVVLGRTMNKESADG